MKKLGFFVLPTLLCISCVTNPATGKKSLILLSPAQENKMGQDAYSEIKKTEKVSKDKRLNAILLRVGKRIAAAVPANFQWEFTLIESKEMNAFCLPGGKVAFYTGIMPVLENEAGMAIVMGHEVAHAVARHGGQRVSQGMIAQLGMGVADLWLKDKSYRNMGLAALGAGAQFGLILPFSRSNETEADTLGIKYAAMAGYDPAEGPRFWTRFSKVTGAGGKPPAWMSTHPSDTSRIRNLKALQQEAEGLYEKSGKYGLGEKI